MMRPKELNSKVLKQLKKETDRILFLKEKIEKYQLEIENIQDSNNWINYLVGDKPLTRHRSDFDKNSNNLECEAFYELVEVIRYGKITRYS